MRGRGRLHQNEGLVDQRKYTQVNRKAKKTIPDADSANLDQVLTAEIPTKEVVVELTNGFTRLPKFQLKRRWYNL